MIEKFRKKVWVNGKVDFFTVLMLVMVPSIPASILGIYLFGPVGKPDFLGDLILSNLPILYSGFVVTVGHFIYTFYCLYKATDHPALDVPEVKN